jgi:hypothetical protein
MRHGLERISMTFWGTSKTNTLTDARFSENNLAEKIST